MLYVNEFLYLALPFGESMQHVAGCCCRSILLQVLLGCGMELDVPRAPMQTTSPIKYENSARTYGAQPYSIHLTKPFKVCLACLSLLLLWQGSA